MEIIVDAHGDRGVTRWRDDQRGTQFRKCECCKNARRDNQPGAKRGRWMRVQASDLFFAKTAAASKRSGSIKRIWIKRTIAAKGANFTTDTSAGMISAGYTADKTGRFPMVIMPMPIRGQEWQAGPVRSSMLQPRGHPVSFSSCAAASASGREMIMTITAMSRLYTGSSWAIRMDVKKTSGPPVARISPEKRTRIWTATRTAPSLQRAGPAREGRRVAEPCRNPVGSLASVRIPDLQETITRRVTSRSGRAYSNACAALLDALNCAKISSAYTSAPNSEGTE